MPKADDIIAELEPIRHVDDGRHFIQLVRFCVKTQLGYTLRTVPPAQTTPAAAKLDSAAILAIGDFAGWEATLQHDDVHAFDAASLVVQLASKRGGWGLTPGAGVADPAFYAADAGFLRWAQSSVQSLLAFHTAQVTPSTDLRSSSHPPVQHLVRVHDFLTAHGAVVVPPV
eukprot:1294921-Rhodomonas_salina.1